MNGIVTLSFLFCRHTAQSAGKFPHPCRPQKRKSNRTGKNPGSHKDTDYLYMPFLDFIFAHILIKAMKQGIKTTIFLFFLVVACRTGSAQITIQQESNTVSRQIEQQPDERFVTPQVTVSPYMTETMVRAERRRIRHERNTFEVKLNLAANQTYYDNWAKGGSNFLNLSGTLYARHIYQKERLSLTSYLDSGLGMNFIDSTTFKSTDKLIFDFSANWNINRSWSYSGQVRGETQFANGYKNHTDTVLRSAFMSPGKTTIAFGFTYAPPGSGFKASISPIGGQMLFVLNDTLSKQGLNGVEPGKHFKPTLGSNIKLEFNRNFGKNDQVNYRTTANAFYDYNIAPQVSWTNTLTLKATRLLSTVIKWDLMYDESVTQGLRDKEYLQCKYEIGIGLLFDYNSKNRKR